MKACIQTWKTIAQAEVPQSYFTACMPALAYLHTHARTHRHTYMHAYVCAYTRIYAYMHTCIHTYRHAYKPTRIHEFNTLKYKQGPLRKIQNPKKVFEMIFPRGACGSTNCFLDLWQLLLGGFWKYNFL